MIRLGLIGVGRWGLNYARAIYALPGVEIAHATSIPPIEKTLFSDSCAISRNWEEICDNTSLNGIIVTSPASTHLEIAIRAIERRVPLLVEKPLALSMLDACLLDRLCKEKGSICFVPYIHLYSEGYQIIKRFLTSQDRIKQIKTYGLSYGPFRRDAPVLWDWGVHEIAIVSDLLDETISVEDCEIVASDSDKANAKIILLRLLSDSGINITCKFGNISQFKKRTLDVETNTSKIAYDDSKPSQILIERSSMTPELLYYNYKRPLNNVINEFIQIIKDDFRDNRTIRSTVEISRILEQAEKLINTT